MLAALGAQSEIGELRASFSDGETTDLKINVPPARPTKHALNAARVVIKPAARIKGPSQVGTLSLAGDTQLATRDGALKSNKGATATFMGMPGDAVVDLIRGRD